MEKKATDRKTEPPTPESVMANILILPKNLRRKARKELRRAIRLRHGSELFSRQNPQLGLTRRDREAITLMVAHGAHYRPLESIFHLAPCNGNDAYRIVKGVLTSDKQTASAAQRIAAKTGVTLPVAIPVA